MRLYRAAELGLASPVVALVVAVGSRRVEVIAPPRYVIDAMPSRDVLDKDILREALPPTPSETTSNVTVRLWESASCESGARQRRMRG